VDVLAEDVIGRLLVAHREAAASLDRWALDDDFWVRRAALLSLLEPLRAGAPFVRFAGYADAMLDEKEFFIRKAIGWVLRETGKRRPEEVYEWLLPLARRASGITLREAVKYLEPAQRKEVLRRASASD
jgi:3-methyladenine DNA glycosylase AlkD